MPASFHPAEPFRYNPRSPIDYDERTPMPSIKIGDKVCEFEGKKTVLQVAQENGIEIPSYCYHPGMSIVASCRICLAEIAQPNPRNDNKLETIPKLVPTCQHMAVDGAEVYTESEKTIANQKGVMEYLLINHPLDCPICDQAGECKLQDYSYRYGKAASRFEESKVKQPKKDVGKHILLYSDRCIMCTRCVRFTREISGTGELGVMGRGNKEEIDVFPGRPLDNELSGNVADICPVGALLDKDFLFEQRVWFLTSAPSIDPITSSGDNIWVDHNQGRVWRIKPRENADINQWWISDEIRYGWKFVHSDDRLLSPKQKQHGAQVDGDWNTALAAASSGLKKATEGGRLAFIASPMISSEDAYRLAKAVRAFDPGALLGVGPVPIDGENKTFPGGYTIYAEKAPNARGVRRALELVAGKDDVLAWDQAAKKLSGITGVVMTGNYPSKWTTPDIAKAVDGKFLVLIDTLPNDLTDSADVLLPAATFAEKSGSFENHSNVIQAFDQAIPLREYVRAESQIAYDLLAAAGLGEAQRFDVAATRTEMGGPFVDDIQRPAADARPQSEMQYAEL